MKGAWRQLVKYKLFGSSKGSVLRKSSIRNELRRPDSLERYVGSPFKSVWVRSKNCIVYIQGFRYRYLDLSSNFTFI